MSFSLHRRSLVRPALAAVLALAAATPAHAQERSLYSWSGSVDKALDLTMQGSVVRRAGFIGANASVQNALPQADGQLRIDLQSGRGTVSVAQQPTAQNNWTGIVHIDDPRPGADRYAFTV